jgi:hypothetical protein
MTNTEPPSRKGPWAKPEVIIGVISVVVAIIFGVAQCGGASSRQGGSPQATPATPASTETNPIAAQQSSRTPVASSPTQVQPSSNQQTWTGTVRISNEDFTHETPQVNGGVFYHGTVQYDSSNNLLQFSSDAVALWNQSNDPSFNDCVNLTQTQALSQDEYQRLPYRPDQGICYVWESGALFLRGEGPPTGEAVEMRGIKWSLQ